MNEEITTIITGLAILVMLYSLGLAVHLKSKIPGGVVGKSWRRLVFMVAFFAVGYIAIPLLGQLSQDAMRMAIALIFLFGAVYVAITIRLIYRVIEELTA